MGGLTGRRSLVLVITGGVCWRNDLAGAGSRFSGILIPPSPRDDGRPPLRRDARDSPDARAISMRRVRGRFAVAARNAWARVLSIDYIVLGAAGRQAPAPTPCGALAGPPAPSWRHGHGWTAPPPAAARALPGCPPPAGPGAGWPGAGRERVRGPAEGALRRGRAALRERARPPRRGDLRDRPDAGRAPVGRHALGPRLLRRQRVPHRPRLRRARLIGREQPRDGRRAVPVGDRGAGGRVARRRRGRGADHRGALGQARDGAPRAARHAPGGDGVRAVGRPARFGHRRRVPLRVPRAAASPGYGHHGHRHRRSCYRQGW